MITTRRGILSLAAATLGACASSAATSESPSAPPTASDVSDLALKQHEGLPPAVFKGENGISVELLHLAAPTDSAPQALLRITGVEHPLSGTVLLATREGTNGELAYKVPFDGTRYNLLRTVVDNSHSSSKLRVTLFLPRLAALMPLQYDEEATAQLDPQAMMADHRRHERSGILDRLTLVDRKYHQDSIARWMRVADKAITESCRTDLKSRVDWQSYSDEHIIERNRCADILRGVASVCSRDTASRRTLLAKVNGIVCEYGEQYRVHIDEEGLLRYALPADFDWNVQRIFDELYSLLELTDTVVRDEEGRILRFSPDYQSKKTAIYLGDEKTMRRLASHSGGSKVAWGPVGPTRLIRGDEGWTVTCPNDRTVAFHPVDDKTRQEVLTSATYVEEPTWQRREFALARDDRGIYYYVDHLAPEFGGQGFRVFRGPRGQVQETTLTDIVDDSNGMIFATRAGKLRLILGKDSESDAVWIEGKRKRKLVLLPLHDNRTLIYTGLGAYDGERFGTICE